MPLLTTALTAGKAAFSLIPKNKEARQKAAQRFSKGFGLLKKGLSNLGSFKKTDTGYSITGKDFSFKAPIFGTPKEEQSDLMKYAPYIGGGLLLLMLMKK